jgi:hypothetical protein
MARIIGLERKQAPWHLRWFYTVMRRMFGKDLTPAKIQMRRPGLVWGSIAIGGRPRAKTQHLVTLHSTGKDPHGCSRRMSLFEWTSILPSAEKLD